MLINDKKIMALFERENRPLLISEIKSKLKLPDNEKIDTELSRNEVIEIIARDRGPGLLTKLGSFYFSKNLLEKYWLNEIKFLLYQQKMEADIYSIESHLKSQLQIHFGLINPAGKNFSFNTDGGLNETNLIDFLLKNEEIFYIRYAKSIKETVVGLKIWQNETNEDDLIKIRSSIISVLRNSDDRTLGIDDIVFGVNRFDVDTLIKKPYKIELIKKIILSDKRRFQYNSESKETAVNEKPILTDDLLYLDYYFKEKRTLLKNYNYDDIYTGIAAFIFIGNNFPFVEATEYVKTRPIIYLEQIEDPLLISDNIEEWLPDELVEYLETLFNNSEELYNWCSENLAVSIYFEHFDEVKLLYPKVIEHFSPVFNIMNNPGNLFQYTLEAKLEEYYNKYPDRKP